MKSPTNINNAPKDATHWAPETDQWPECWYRFEDGLWYTLCDYWADAIDEYPWSPPAKNWNTKSKGVLVLKRPLTELIPLEKLK